MTKREMYEMTINILAETVAPKKDELIAGLQHEIELLANRKTSKTPTKVQKENEVIMTQILKALEAIGEPTTVTNLITFGIEGFELTNQKVSALLRKLVEAGKVVKTIEGKKAKFAIA